jgi:hypothetical protein
MLGWIHEKMATQESAPGGGRFFTFGSTVVGNGALACSDPYVPGGDYLITAKNNSWDNAHTFDPSSRGEKLSGEPSILVQCAEHTSGSLVG